MIGPLIWYQICNCNHHNIEEILNFQFSTMSSYSWICPLPLFNSMQVDQCWRICKASDNMTRICHTVGLFHVFSVSNVYYNLLTLISLNMKVSWKGLELAFIKSTQILMHFTNQSLINIALTYKPLCCQNGVSNKEVEYLIISFLK